MKTKIFALCCLLGCANAYTLQAAMPEAQQQIDQSDEAFGDSGIPQSFAAPTVTEFPSVMMIKIDAADNNKVIGARELTPEELQNFQQTITEQHCAKLAHQRATMQGELVSIGYGAWCVAKGSVMILFLGVEWLAPYAVTAATPLAQKLAEYARIAWTYIVAQSTRAKEATMKRYREWKQEPSEQHIAFEVKKQAPAASV